MLPELLVMMIVLCLIACSLFLLKYATKQKMNSTKMKLDTVLRIIVVVFEKLEEC